MTVSGYIGGRRLGLWGLLLAILVILGCNSAGSPTEPRSAQSVGEIEFDLLQFANQARRQAGGESCLSVDPLLTAIARNHSRDMRDRGYLGHVSPDGTTLRQRLEAEGVEFSRAAENIVQVTNVADAAAFAHELLMESERHRANILDDRFCLVGIGVASADVTYWITQVFIRN